MIDRDAGALDAHRARLGPAALPLRLDLLDPADCAAILPRILEVAGALDIFHAMPGPISAAT